MPFPPSHSPSRGAPRSAQRGAAILIALLVVTLVATFSVTALWQQWRATEIEAAERARLQSAWVLIGALDWSRLILREDGRATRVDHLAEPWAVPLAEASLTTFLAADKNVSSDALAGLPEAFLSGQIVDAQAKLNVRNLVQSGRPAESAVNAFNKLFELLGLPTEQVNLLVQGLLRADTNVPGAASAAGAGGGTDGAAAGVTRLTASAGAESKPLMPQRFSELVWFGLPPSTLAAIEPYVTLLPTVTPLNVNTASAEAIFASAAKLDMACAKRLVTLRQRQFLQSLAEANDVVQECGAQFVAGQQSVATSYFEVRGRLRIDTTWVEERSLVRRDDGLRLTVLWRERGAGLLTAPGQEGAPTQTAQALH